MGGEIGDLDLTFTATIGVKVKAMTWGGVELPGTVDTFGTARAVRVDVTVDGEPMRSVELLPTGRASHMLLLDPRFRSRIGKDVGDEVTVKLTKRHT